MSLDRQIHALRSSAAWTRSSHVTCLRLEGSGAFDLLDRICPAELFLRDGQMTQTLLLDEKGVIVADLCLACDDEHYFLLLEGMTADGFAVHVRTYAPDQNDFLIVDLSPTHDLISINGPFAWEVLAELVGPDVVGLPYMTFFRPQEWICFRSGKTGEFGYDILVPRNEAPELVQRVEALAPTLDLHEATLEALDLCALENWFFNIRKEGRLGLTPLELQLQWRITRHKDFTGSDALAAKRRQGVENRLTTVLAEERIDSGDSVTLDGKPVGTLISVGRSISRSQWIGLALLEIDLAHAGIERFIVQGMRLRTVAPPVLNNLSLFVSPQIHCYRTRNEIVSPGLVREFP